MFLILSSFCSVVLFVTSFFSIHVRSDKTPADLTQHKGINDLISSIRDKLDDVASESNYYHFREEENRNTAEAGSARVAWLTVMETVVLLIVTASEIFLIRSWFAENSKRAKSWA